MKVLVVGGGGREHALVWKLAQSTSVDKMFAVPGNAGIASIAECVERNPSDPEEIADLVDELSIDLTVVGPEVPLVAGLADTLAARGRCVFGPSAAAARIEGSKSWAKEIIEKAGAPSPRARAFTAVEEAVAFLSEFDPPYVVKADGLAAGKGVTIAEDRATAVRAIEESLVGGRFGAAGATVVIEEFLTGEELSVFCLTDGRAVVPLAAAQDFKRVFDGDQGPNTGGMGAYSPVPHLPHDTVARAVREIVEPVVAQMSAARAPFRGLLYAGLMVTESGPKVIEFNCRFGDPETQAVLPRLRSDLAELLLACAEGNLADQVPLWSPDACVTVALASGGYPGEYRTGAPITGLDQASALPDVAVFHAGTAFRDGRVVTAGGRVLSVSALGPDIATARARAYDAAGLIDFDGKHLRRDIAMRAAEREGAS